MCDIEIKIIKQEKQFRGKMDHRVKDLLKKKKKNLSLISSERQKKVLQP